MPGRPIAEGLAALAALGALGGCARELPPPGARPDEIPPRVESIEPEPGSVLPGFDGEVRLRFDEPVTVSQDLERRLFTSPMERYRVEAGFSDLKLRPEAGWRDSIVYCLRIPEGITDLLRNRTTEPTDFCFSTGIEIPDTRVSGTVFDAVTGNPLVEARVLFLAPGDSTPYGAITDQDGAFSARSLPPGPYEAFGFVDQNRNLMLDRELEAHDSVTFVAAVDSAPRLTLRAVPPDTTPPLLLRVTVIDSVTLELEFDDPLRRPAEAEPEVTVRDSASGAAVPLLAARLGSVAEADLPPLPGDTAGAAADSAAEAAALRPPGAPAPAAPPPAEAPPAGPPLPTRFVSVRTAEALAPGTYHASARGLVNLRRLVGGGDTTFVYEPPADTTGAALDTLTAPADTTEAALDTLGAPPDTLGAPADTLSLGRRRR